MLAGIKFIPRDHVDDSLTQELFDSGSSPKATRSKDLGKASRTKKKRDDKKRRKKSHHDSSEDDDNNHESGRLRGRGRSMGRKKKKKAFYRSDDDSIPSQSTSDSYSESEEEKLRRKRRSKGKKDSSSSDKGVISSDGSGGQHHQMRRKHVKETRKKINEDGGNSSRKDREIIRKEMGLEWMFKPKDAAERVATEPDDAQEEPELEEVKRSNPRELNPYLKDNGSGFPDDTSHEISSSSALLPSSVVGDGGASWRLKALKRAQEQAAREGRKLDKVVEERWGSLGQLTASVASHRVAHTHAHLHAIKDRRRGTTKKSEMEENDKMKGETAEAYTGRRDYLRDVSSHHPEMRKPKHDFYTWKKKKTDNSSSGDNPIISNALSKLNKFANDGSFMDEMILQRSEHASASGSSHVDMEVSKSRVIETVPSNMSDTGKERSDGTQGLSANQLAAKALQLRLKGKHEEAERLLKEVESMSDNQVSKSKAMNQETEGETSRYIGRRTSSQLKKREDDADLKLAQKIIQNRQYSISGQADDEYDFDEAPTRKCHKKREVAEEKHNLSKRIFTHQERCQFCFENPTRPKHLVISIANFTYMMLPQWQPVVQGHCCILPLQHEASTRTVDDNVWEEIRNFKKCLIMMFGKQDKEVVFLETVIGLSKQQRHCLVECIPLPRALAKEAPLYFKKAIDEATDEWSQHHAKRLIETTTEKSLRRSVPKDFPYFHVEFGLDRGFVHVIDDESRFKSNLGLNVIRGMLRLPEEDMYRRRRHEPMEKQRSAVASFAQEWEPFDWTKQLG